MEKLQLLSKEDLLNLQIGDEIMIAYQKDPLRTEKNVYKVLSIQSIIPEGRHKKIKIRFIYDSIDYNTNKPRIRKWNLVIGDSINKQGEQRLYSDSFSGRAGTCIFFKLNK